MPDRCQTGTILLLMRLMRVLHVRETEEAMGLKLKQLMLLSHLRDLGEEIPQQQLGDAIGLDANNLVLMLNDLEVDELVERRRDPADRRRHKVVITPAGRRRLERAEVGLEEHDAEVLKRLSAEEQETLRALLAKAVIAPATPPVAAATR